MLLKINNSILILSLSVFLLIFSSIKVFADENVSASKETEADIEEILVTANRTEQSISDVSQAVQALSGDDLQDLQITDFEQMIDLIPGAVQNSSISQGSNVYSIRGVASAETDGDATIGYYLDNFAFSLPGRPYAPVTDIYDTESHVEQKLAASVRDNAPRIKHVPAKSPRCRHNGRPRSSHHRPWTQSFRQALPS